ncbi:MAG TPA: protein kinase, partial [Acidobacteriota bacterium]|nr:protein kinase [Acidobacteriota bacterium]
PAEIPSPPAAKEEPPAPPTMMIARDKILEAVATIPEEGMNFGQYLLLSKIATGGMAELFKAKRKGVEGFEKILAIKKILPHMSDNEEFITMFIDEAKLAAQLSHHNICQIFDLGKIENSYYIAMEYVHGKDLRAVLKAAHSRSKTIPVELAILITSKICSALDYAHRKRGVNGQPLNLVHRDVSPQNILISYEGDVKLVDFGIAKAATKVHVTQHGALKGKLLYMSPEQAWGRSVDRRSDVFSVGVVLYEMLTGRPLFFDENDTEVTILDKVREARVVPIRDINQKVSPELEKIILKALKKEPEDRYQVASEMQKDLDNLFYTEGFNATSASLASFARSLFPEEWGLESGTKDTLMIDREMAEAIKAAQPAAAVRHETPTPVALKPPAARPAPPTAPPPAAPPAPPIAPAQAAAPAPQPLQAVQVLRPAPEPVPKPRVEPESEKKQPPAKPVEPAAPAFRDISMPEIIPTQPEKSNTALIALGIIALVVVIGVIAFFLFRSKPAEQIAQPQPSPSQTTATPAATTPVNPA